MQEQQNGKLPLLAKAYIKNETFPEKYFADALHTALASVNQIGILLISIHPTGGLRSPPNLWFDEP